jgi:succinate dehydrogenase / fumarate reductase cytochrome b subunit
MKSPDIPRKTHPNKLGIFGWVYAGPYNIERYLYTLHRVTGLGVLLYLVMHIFLTWFKNDPEMWDTLMMLLNNPFARLGEYCVFFGVMFHAMNGIRLIIGELGYMMGKPERPIYPYPIAVLRQRPLLVVLMLLTAVFVVYGAIDIFIYTH